jgi:Ser/Thr protein kinase RdoA (MazF antagonist)
LNVHGRLANTAGMPRKPETPKPTSWNIYKVGQKAILLGTFKAPDKRAAIEKAAEEFKADPWRLYAVPRR